MKIAVIVVRILLGGMMAFAAVSYFFNLGDQPTPTGDMATVMGGFMATKYLFPLVKSIELISGLALITGKFMKLALIILLPITVNILLIHVFLAPADIPMAAAIFAAHLFLIYANWSSYKHLFTA
jgi:hypothetical protein